MEPPIEECDHDEPIVHSLNFALCASNIPTPNPLGSDWLDDFCIEMDAIISSEPEAGLNTLAGCPDQPTHRRPRFIAGFRTETIQSQLQSYDS